MITLIIIYIIKPNYQVKHISSTFVWKLSLRYRRRKLPTNTIRNILLFVCQLLILTSMAGILAKPVFTEESAGDRYEVIAVIDSSASMHTFTADGETRYDRAVDEAIDLMNDTFERDGLFSLIYADDAPVYSVRSYGKEQRNLVESQFEKECPYGGADVDAAMTRCRDVLSENPSAKVYFYTNTVYELPAETVEDELPGFPAYKSVTVEEIAVKCVNGEDCFVDIFTEENRVNLFVIGKTIYLVSACQYDEATETYIVRAGTGDYYSICVKDDVAVITKIDPPASAGN